MEDTSFVDLTKDENIKKINIDNRLIDAFKLAMIKIQEYFNKNNYANGKNYDKFFSEFLLGDSKRKLSIVVSNSLLEGAAGTYNSGKCSIEISEDYVNGDINELAHIICHEFIHFIVHHELDILYGDRWGGESFIDEAYTEQLTREIIPVDVNYYGPIPNLIDFYNKIMNKQSDYSILLERKIPDFLRIDYFPYSFIRNGNNCIENFKNGEYLDNGYEFDENYLNIQRNIIELLDSYEINNYDDFISFINIINSRPADDREWVINYIINKCSNIINDDETKQIIIEYANCLNIISRSVYRFNVGTTILTFNGNKISGLNSDIEYWYIIENGKNVLEFCDKNQNRAILDYKNINVTNKNELYNNKARLEEELKSRIKSKTL